MPLHTRTLIVFLCLAVTFPAFADKSAERKAFRERQSKAMKALIVKLNADDGGNAQSLVKEALTFKADHKAQAIKQRVAMSVRTLDEAIGKLRRRGADKAVLETSAAKVLGLASDDIFDHAKVLAAFSNPKMSRDKLYRLPKVKMKQGLVTGRGPVARELMPGESTQLVRNASLQSPEAQWHKLKINTRYPFATVPPEGTVVMLWEVKGLSWRVVTPSGAVYAVSRLQQDRRGVEGGVWDLVGQGFVNSRAAQRLTDLGIVGKKTMKGLLKTSKSLWKCHGKAVDKATRKVVVLMKSKMASSVRQTKIRAVRAAMYKGLDKSCEKKRVAYGKALAAVALDHQNARKALLAKVKAVPAR